MGGARGVGNMTAVSEFNVGADPHAARIVMEAGWPVTMVGLDLTHQALATPDVQDRIATLGTGPARLVVDLLRTYGAAYAADGRGFDSPPVHDVCAVARVIDDTIVRAVRAPLTVELDGTTTTGMTVTDERRVAPEHCVTSVATTLDVDGFWDLVLDALRRLGDPAV